MEAGGFGIEITKTSLEAAESTFVFVEFFDTVVSINKEIFESGIVGLDGFVGDGEEILLDRKSVV